MILEEKREVLDEKPSQEKINEAFDGFLDEARCIRTADAMLIATLENVSDTSAHIHIWGGGTRKNQLRMISDLLTNLQAPKIVVTLLEAFIAMEASPEPVIHEGSSSLN